MAILQNIGLVASYLIRLTFQFVDIYRIFNRIVIFENISWNMKYSTNHLPTCLFTSLAIKTRIGN